MKTGLDTGKNERPKRCREGIRINRELAEGLTQD